LDEDEMEDRSINADLPAIKDDNSQAMARKNPFSVNLWDEFLKRI